MLFKIKKITTPLNFAVLDEVTGGEGELQNSLIALYLATTERCITTLETLTHVDDDELWHKTSHELKGASSSIRAETMAEICRQIEHFPLDPEERMRACELLREAYAELKVFVEETK